VEFHECSSEICAVQTVGNATTIMCITNNLCQTQGTFIENWPKVDINDEIYNTPAPTVLSISCQTGHDC
jgi:hypothetical protein